MSTPRKCPCYQKFENLSPYWGIGYCDIDRSVATCKGATKSCRNLLALKRCLREQEKEIQDSKDPAQRRKYPRHSITLPLEYWKRDYFITQAGVSGDLSEAGLRIYSIFNNLCAGEELMIRVFYADGYELGSIKVIARVVWKDVHCETDWNGYKYGLKFVHISREDREKLKLLCCRELPEYKMNGGIVPRPRESVELAACARANQ